MARSRLGRNGGSKLGGSFNRRTRTALVVCSINIGIGLYVFHFMYTPLYIFQYNNNVGFMYRFGKFSPQQLRKIEESIQIRKAYEPVELIRLVKQVEKEMLSEEESTLSLPKNMKQKMRDEIIQRLRALDEDADLNDERGVLENWREQKLKEAKQVVLGMTINSTLVPEEAGLLSRALESHWGELSEELGIWIPVDVDVDEHEDKPEDAPDLEEEEILPGRELPGACHAELHTHYDGAAIRWGHNFHKQSAFDCCQACWIQAKRAAPGEMKCNVWVFCPSVKGCYFPDVYQHEHMECWLKYAESPRVNFKDKYPESYREAHPGLPVIVPWVSGIITA